jgi:hypothetical protein
MQEPDWSTLGPEYYDKPAGVGSLIWTFKKTRGRFGAMTPATPGDHGLVISRWVSSMGSEKISFITSDLRELATTATCTRLWGSLNDQCTSISAQTKWQDVKLKWMDETFVPIFVAREKTTSKRAKSKFVVSRNGSSVLVKPIFGSNMTTGLWLKETHVHPIDWRLMLGSKSGEACHSLRVPEWVAKKAGLL